MVERVDGALRVVEYDGDAFRGLIFQWGARVLVTATWAELRPGGTVEEGRIHIEGGGA